MTTRTDRWCFTKHKGHEAKTASAVDNPQGWIEHIQDTDLVNFIICQREIAPTTGTIHLQGYVEFHNRYTLKAASKIINASMKIANGTAQENITYCTKIESKDPDLPGPWTFGTPKVPKKGQGQRTDLKKVDQMIHENKSEEEISKECGPEMMKYSPGIRNLISIRNATNNWTRKINRSPRKEMTGLIIHWGVTGSGKTHHALLELEKDGIKVFNKPRGMWDGYNNEEVVLIDEFDKLEHNKSLLGEMLTLADKYPLKMKVRYNTIEFNSKLIILTSNQNPKEWWTTMPQENQDAFWRRVSNIFYWPLQYGDIDWTGKPDEECKPGTGMPETPQEVINQMMDYFE